MTDEQIIKALEHNASKCKFYEDGHDGGLFESTLDLINRLKAENERLKAENKSIRYCYEQAKSYNDTLVESCEKNCKHFNMTTRAEAIKEFAEKLKEEIRCEDDCGYHCYDCCYGCKDYVTAVDNLVKEMTEINE